MGKRAAWPLIALSLSAVASATLTAPQPYRLEKTHVDLLFSINHAGFTQKHGSFRELDATLQYDPQSPDKSQISVTVETASLDTGDATRDRDVKSPQFLDVVKYPQMRFVSTKVVPAPNGTFLVEGTLTLHGVTKPLTLRTTLNKDAPSPFDKRPTLGFSATASLKRIDFGIATYLPLIGDEVNIQIDAEFNQKSGA
jgi:polyisoprenoid-binding protein YceI